MFRWWYRDRPRVRNHGIAWPDGWYGMSVYNRSQYNTIRTGRRTNGGSFTAVPRKSCCDDCYSTGSLYTCIHTSWNWISWHVSWASCLAFGESDKYCKSHERQSLPCTPRGTIAPSCESCSARRARVRRGQSYRALRSTWCSPRRCALPSLRTCEWVVRDWRVRSTSYSTTRILSTITQ